MNSRNAELLRRAQAGEFDEPRVKQDYKPVENTFSLEAKVAIVVALMIIGGLYSWMVSHGT